MQVPENELKGFILDSGLVSRKDVDAAEIEAKRRGQSIGDLLLAQGLLSSDSLRRTKAYVLGIPFVNLKDRKIGLDVLSLIPEPVARAHSIVAYGKDDGALEVAMLDTEDLPSIDAVRRRTGLRILPRLTDDESLKRALLQYQKSLKEEFGDLITVEAGRINLMQAEAPGADLKAAAEDLSVVRIVDTMLRHAIIQKASDIHIEPMEEELLVRYRIDGVLHDAMTLPRAAAPGITARIKLLADLALDEARLPQDGRFKMETETDKVSFRVSMLPTYFGEKTVMRLLRETGEGFTLDALGFHGAGLESVHKAMKQSGGLILIAGPGGSGKTTALYTILDILNAPDVNIATVEDPIEYQMKRVNQTQVNPAIGLTYASGLRALLRQDPNIIMVGEIRDAETASLAVNAALTGHLVLSTIHTNSAAGAIARLIDMGVEPFLLASALRMVVGQRLVRRLCDEKDQYALDRGGREEIASADEFKNVLVALSKEKLVREGMTLDAMPFYRPVPSSECEDGYSGRIGIQEVIAISPSMRELIARAATPDAIEAQARKEGTLTLFEDGLYKSAQGITSVEEVLKAVAE